MTDTATAARPLADIIEERLRDAVADLPGIRAYLKSARRLPFNTDGIFRHYPELDPA